eukprot:1196312-Prorocentrum_minimum.AAC.6
MRHSTLPSPLIIFLNCRATLSVRVHVLMIVIIISLRLPVKAPCRQRGKGLELRLRTIPAGIGRFFGERPLSGLVKMVLKLHKDSANASRRYRRSLAHYMLRRNLSNISRATSPRVMTKE